MTHLNAAAEAPSRKTMKFQMSAQQQIARHPAVHDLPGKASEDGKADPVGAAGITEEVAAVAGQPEGDDEMHQPGPAPHWPRLAFLDRGHRSDWASILVWAAAAAIIFSLFAWPLAIRIGMILAITLPTATTT